MVADRNTRNFQAVRGDEKLGEVRAGSLVGGQGFEVQRWERRNRRNGANARESVSGRIILTTDMSDIRGKLGDKLQMTGLTARPLRGTLEGVAQRLVIGEYMESVAFHIAPEVGDGTKYSEQLSIKSRVYPPRG